MSAVKHKDTGPEMAVRKTLYRLGYRYRLHVKDLPGTPDIVFPGRQKVVFVHGCFWHGHLCDYGKLPKSNLDYWRTKIATNRKRDARNLRELYYLGWEVMIIWQCELKRETHVVAALRTFLDHPKVIINCR